MQYIIAEFFPKVVTEKWPLYIAFISVERKSFLKPITSQHLFFLIVFTSKVKL